MKPVARYTQSKEQQAARELGRAQQAHEAGKEKLEKLLLYREDYANQFIQAAAGKGIDGMRAQDYQAFMQNLDKAIVQQKAANEQLLRDFEMKKRQWLAARNRAKAINTVVENYQQVEQRQEEKKEQKEQDDRAATAMKKS